MNNFVYFILLFIFLSCSSNKISYNNKEDLGTPPNGYSINDLQYIDKTEVPNLDYRFFTSWTKHNFGAHSKVYLHVLPDTTVWLGQVENDTFLMNHYFRDQKFERFPVVGVSKEQAQLFSIWRADRIFKTILIQQKLIPPPGIHRESEVFTIKKYLAGEYMDYEPDTNIRYYPSYRLPKRQEIEEANAVFEQQKQKHLARCKGKHCNDCDLDEYEYASQLNTDYQLKTFESPTRPVTVDCHDFSLYEIHNLKGNVSEWLLNVDSTYGGSWKDTISGEDMMYKMTEKNAAATIGFRNFCEWKKISYDK